MCDHTKEYLQVEQEQFYKVWGFWYYADGTNVGNQDLIDELDRKFLETYKST